MTSFKSTLFHNFRLVGLGLILSISMGSVTKAASFDCTKATTETEIAICGSTRLQSLDLILDIIYQDIFSTNFGEIADRAFKDQKEWIILRDRCLSNNSCLIEKYSSRIQQLPFANYDGFHEPFNGYFLLPSLNNSLTKSLYQILPKYDLVAIDSVINETGTGTQITTSFLIRDKSLDPFFSCGMMKCNSNSAYFGYVSGAIDQNFTLDDISIQPANEWVEDRIDVELDVVSKTEFQIWTYWLRGGRHQNFIISDDNSVRLTSQSTGGVSSPGLGTMYSENIDFVNNVIVEGYGYVFGKSLKLRPRLLSDESTLNNCAVENYKECDLADIYDLGVRMYADPSTINISIEIFEYLISKEYPGAEEGYTNAKYTAEEM